MNEHEQAAMDQALPKDLAPHLTPWPNGMGYTGVGELDGWDFGALFRGGFMASVKDDDGARIAFAEGPTIRAAMIAALQAPRCAQCDVRHVGAC